VGSRPDRVKPKTIKWVFVASRLSKQHYGKKIKFLLARNQDNMSK
jgi:hypothetical protein